MKRFNKIIAILLAVVMIAGFMVTGVSATEPADKVVYHEGFEIGDTFTALPAGEPKYTTSRNDLHWNGAEPSDNNGDVSLAWAEGSKSLVEVVEGAGRDGGDCVRFSEDQAGTLQRVNIVVKYKEGMQHGKHYVASVWVKLDVDETSAKPSATGGIRAKNTAATNNPNIGSSYSVDKDWHKVEVPYIYDEEKGLNFDLNLMAKDAVVYLDDFQIVERSISVSGSNTVAVDKTVALSADVTQEYSALVWSTENTDIVSVDPATGVVTGIKEGTATIKATATVKVWNDTAKNFTSLTEDISATYEVTVVDGQIYNTTAGGYYKTLANAMAAVSNGDMIKLIGDVEETAGVMIPAGVTLDLAGKTLTVPSLAALKGADVIDSVGGGKIVVADGNLMLQKDNSYVPVKDGNGYVFLNAKTAVKQEAAEGNLTYQVKPSLTAGAGTDNLANTLFADGAADNGITVVIRISWKVGENDVSLDFVANDELVESVYTPNQSGQYAPFSLTASNVAEGATVSTVLISDAGVEFVVPAAN